MVSAQCMRRSDVGGLLAPITSGRTPDRYAVVAGDIRRTGVPASTGLSIVIHILTKSNSTVSHPQVHESSSSQGGVGFGARSSLGA